MSKITASKKQSRSRRSRKTRAKIKSLGLHRLCVHRTPKHIYAQVIQDENGTVVASAATVEKDFQGQNMGNKVGATTIGKLIAERAQKAGVSNVAFDRSGFKYHGRVAALADAAREAGLTF